MIWTTANNHIISFWCVWISHRRSLHRY